MGEREHELRQAGFFRRMFMCPLSLCSMVQRDDDTHIWGECLRCGKRAGLVSRDAIRRYIEAEALHKAFVEEQAAILKAKP